MACIICGNPFYIRRSPWEEVSKIRVGTHGIKCQATHLGTQPCLFCDVHQIPDASRSWKSWRSWFVLAGRGYLIPSMDHNQPVRYKGSTDNNSSRTHSVAAEGFEGTITFDRVLVIVTGRSRYR